MATIEPEKIQIGVDETINTPALMVTPVAATTIRNLLEQREIPNHSLRVFVAGGGCSGLQYGMAFEEGAQADDTVVQVDGVQLIVDPTSLVYLQGATIDFVDSLMGGGFRIENPNSAGGCGCGKSFKAHGEEADGTAGQEGSCSTCGSY